MDDRLTLRGPEPQSPREWLTFLRTAREQSLHVDEVFRREHRGVVCLSVVTLPAAFLDPVIARFEDADRLEHERDAAVHILDDACRALRRAKAIAVITGATALFEAVLLGLFLYFTA